MKKNSTDNQEPELILSGIPIEEDKPKEEKAAKAEKAEPKNEQPAGKAKEEKTASTADLDDDASVQSLKAALVNKVQQQAPSGSKKNTLTMILGGDIFSAQLVRNNIWLILIVVAFVVVYISFRYSAQQSLLEIDKLNKELIDAKYRALSTSSQLTEKSRESRVMEMLKNSKDSTLKVPSQPPYIINVPEK